MPIQTDVEDQKPQLYSRRGMIGLLLFILTVIGAVLGTLYIIRDYIRDCTNTKVRLLKAELEEEALSENEEVYLHPTH